MTTKALHAPLWPRHRQVIRLSWEGLSNTEIAARLGISRETVACYFAEAYRRLDVSGCGSPRVLAAVWLWRQEEGVKGADAR